MINIYSDESCHLEHDNSDVMVIGAVACNNEMKSTINKDIRSIKEKHGIKSTTEIKWTKVSTSKINMYYELIDYFFDNDDLKFRAIVTLNKKSLNHDVYNNGEHDLWYYKMYYYLFDNMCTYPGTYRIFIDVKDTNGGPRIRKLKEVLCNNKYDFKNEMIRRIDQVESSRVDLLQLTDILIGALCFYHRGLYKNDNSSLAKKQLVKKVMERAQEKFYGTHVWERKFNIFLWTPKL